MGRRVGSIRRPAALPLIPMPAQEHPSVHRTTNRAANRLASFRHAFDGVSFVFHTTPNAWIHLAITVIVIGVGWWLQLGALHWAALALVVGLVWIAEFINTAIESAVDMASPEIHPLAGAAKDVAAAAVLLAAGTAVVVGLLVLGPPLLARLFP